ncbi:cytochrome P450 [Sandaracinus amylolyticus]|uniref:cytochrome P450 n=1 Tax=Sandaracinus amylolyticus TaxID=927083 RepID=UPI001F40619B|nr:cytochrome P450 [Sandaracinus amylolyticus]UJR78359.1 Lanosterol 14-alpha demethylase Cyp [Sandaracinus amylolyticus]
MQLRSLVDQTVKRATRRSASEIPSGLRPPPRLSGGLPVMGHSVEFVRATIELLFRANRELGEVAAFSVFNREMVAMFGPEAHEAVFRAPDAVLSPTEAYKIMTPVFGKDVVYDATPEKMAEQLKMLLPALKDRRMRTYGEAVVHETAASTREWGTSGVVDFVEFCRVLTNFTSSRCLLGKEFREGMSEEFARVYHDLEGGVTPLAYIDPHLPVPAFRKRDKARVRMVEMISGIVRDRRAHQRTGEDFLQTLMESNYSDGRGLSEHEITGLLLAGIFAGHHTSSVTTAWTLLELLQNPTQLQRCVAEVDRVFGDGRPVSHAALRELTTIENAVKEALRLHPPLFMLVRVVKQDFTYKQYFIPKGTWIVVSPTVSHRIPTVFRDPDAFDPDRYLPGREEDKKDFAYIAFGGGRHKCLGNAFAILQIKAILALLLGQFEFGLCGDAIAPSFQGLVIGPKEPCRVRYRRRAQPSVTMEMGTELAAAAKDAIVAEVSGAKEVPQAVQQAAAAAGCPAHAHVNGASASKGASLRVKVDRDLCQGHAVCASEAPEVFAVSPKDHKVMLKLARPPVELHDKVRKAAQYCPNHVIRIEETD